MAVSAAAGEGVLELMRRTYQMLTKLEKVYHHSAFAPFALHNNLSSNILMIG